MNYSPIASRTSSISPNTSAGDISPARSSSVTSARRDTATVRGNWSGPLGSSLSMAEHLRLATFHPDFCTLCGETLDHTALHRCAVVQVDPKPADKRTWVGIDPSLILGVD